MVAFYAVQWDLGILPKWLVISTFALALTLGVYLLVIRQVNGIRWLFGMKPRRRSPQKTGNDLNDSKQAEQAIRTAITGEPLLHGADSSGSSGAR